MGDRPENLATPNIQSTPHAYPMARPGGLFLVFIGLGLIGSILFSGAALVNYTVFFVGIAVATISLFSSRRLSFGSPTRFQLIALVSAVGLEIVLFNIMGRTLPPATDEHIRWLWVSIIVGIHFFPMAVCFGPRMALLGGACIASAVAGLLVDAPYEIFGFIDGILKLGFGIWLISTKPPRAAEQAA